VKQILILFLTIFSLNSFASNELAKVDDVYCGEMDPFVIGDVCVINLSKANNTKLAIVIDMDEFFNIYDEGDLDGKSVEVDSSTLSPIYDSQTLSILRDFDNEYFYLTGSIDSIVLVNTANEMQKMLNLMNGRYSLSKLPVGYKSKKLSYSIFNTNGNSLLKSLSAEKKALWTTYVLESGKYDDRTLAEVQKIIKNPWKELKVKFLVEVREVHKITKNGKLVGYFVEADDHVEAEMIEDGAWMIMFLDVDQNLVKLINETA